MNDPDYQQQLQEKIQRIQKQFSEFAPPELEIFTSPKCYFRMRAEFRIWHDNNDLSYVMFKKNNNIKQMVKMKDFPIASLAINQLMPKLLTYLTTNNTLKERLFEINFLSSRYGQMLISLIYHKTLNEQWQQEAQKLAEYFYISVIGRSRGQKIIIKQDFVLEQMNVQGETYLYQQIESSFTQPNAEVCEKMLNWACDIAQKQSNRQDLLELYCGNGNFTLPLSRYFRQVLATEIAKNSVQSANWNIKQNNVNNIQIARLSAEEFSQAYRGERSFRRLQEAKIELKNYQFSTVFVDPPRAGIDNNTLKLLKDFSSIIYISCNPDTLYNNLQILSTTHQIHRFALFDQFPYTYHVECGVHLRKNSE